MESGRYVCMYVDSPDDDDSRIRFFLVNNGHLPNAVSRVVGLGWSGLCSGLGPDLGGKLQVMTEAPLPLQASGGGGLATC